MENQRRTNPETAAPASGTAMPQGNSASVNEASGFGNNPSTSEFPPPPKRQDYSVPPPRADAATAHESSSSHRSGPGIVDKVKGVAAQGHGFGENLRGNFNAAVDNAFNDKKGQARDEAIAGKGQREVLNKEFDHDKKPPKLS